MFIGESKMKLTTKALRSLINEVMNEDVLNEVTWSGALQKINDDMKPFFVVSAARSERGGKSSPGNLEADRDLQAFFKSKDLSFTKVDGGYTEYKKKVDPVSGDPLKDKDGEPVYELDKKGNKIPIVVEEYSYVVFGDDPHYGSDENRITDTMQLFKIAKESCLVDPKNPQEVFSFGYPINDETTGETNMQIALYKPEAQSPALKHGFFQWGGPWSSIEAFASDAEGAYTSFRGSRSTFVEEQLEEARYRRVATINEGRKKQADINKWSKALKRIKRIT